MGPIGAGDWVEYVGGSQDPTAFHEDEGDGALKLNALYQVEAIGYGYDKLGRRRRGLALIGRPHAIYPAGHFRPTYRPDRGLIAGLLRQASRPEPHPTPPPRELTPAGVRG